jgi:hypothetical protein
LVGQARQALFRARPDVHGPGGGRGPYQYG